MMINLQVKTSEINVTNKNDKSSDYIHIDNETFIVGQNGNSKAISFIFNQNIYIDEEAGDNMNFMLLELWQKYKKGGTSLQEIEANILDYIKKCFLENKASYDQEEYAVYKKLTKSF